MPHGANWGGVPSASPFLASALLDEEKTTTTTISDLLATPSFTPPSDAVTVHFTCTFGGAVTGAFELQLDGVKVGQVGASAWNGRSCVAISQRITVSPGMPCVIGVVWFAKQVGTLYCNAGNESYDMDHASIVVTL